MDAAISAIGRAGDAPVDMKYFTAREQSTASYSAEKVREADLYMAIVGFRYGTPVRDAPELSHTELEFRVAGEASLPRFVFMLDEKENLPLPVEFCADSLYQERQQAFRRNLRGGQVTPVPVGTPDRLEILIYQALTDRGSGLPLSARGSGSDRAGLFQPDGAIDGLVSQGEGLLANGDSTGIGVLERAVGQAPRTRQQALAHARALLLLGRWGEALAELDALLAQGEDAWTLANRAQVYAALNRRSEALRDCDRALALDADNSFVYWVRGTLQQMSNNRRRARRDYDRSLKIAPENVYALITRGQIEMLEENYQRGLADFSAALRAVPNNCAAIAGRGWAYLGLKRPAEAIVEFERVLRINPNDPGAVNGQRAAQQALASPGGVVAAIRRAFGG